MTLTPEIHGRGASSAHSASYYTEYQMNNFTPRCRVLPPVKHGKPFKLKLLEYVKLLHGDRIIMEFEVGFVSDGATVPRWFWWICPQVDKYLAAAFCHDKLCDKASQSADYAIRQSGDDNFYAWLKMCGVSDWRAKPMSWLVQGYGKTLKLRGKLK